MKIHRFTFLTHFAAACLLAFSVLLLARGVTQAVPTVTGTLTSPSGSMDATAAPGDTNVKIAEFDIAVATSSVITNGSSYVIAEGNPLTQIESDTTIRFVDSAGLSTYTDGDIVFDTVDQLVDTTDTVLFGGPFEQFPATPEATGRFGADAWLDQNSNGIFDSGEDFMGLGTYASAAVDGASIRLFGSNEISATNGLNGLNVDPFIELIHTGDPEDPAFITDTDNDDVLSAGDVVTVAGAGNIDPLSASDNVCFDGSISDDSEFDYTDSTTYENIWWDAAGDCSAFTTGDDIILTGSGVPTGTSTEFGTEAEVGYLNIMDTGNYVCARAAECYEIVYTGVNGTNWSDGDNFNTANIFFDPSPVATDGLIAAADEWGSGGYTLNTLTDLSLVAGGESMYAYIDTNADTNYDHGEAILTRTYAEPAGNAVMATGQTFLLFGEHDYYYLDVSPGVTPDFSADREVLFLSADAVLDTGAIDGSGTDDLVYRPSEVVDSRLNLFSDDNRSLSYYDHNASGSLEIGDDIIEGVGAYNVDDLLIFQIGETTIEPDALFDDNTLDAVYLYRSAGATCTGAGTDTLIASDVVAPILLQDMTVTSENFFVSDNGTFDNQLCLYADLASDAPLGSRVHIEVPDNSVDFLSGTVASVGFVDNPLLISESIDVTPSISPGHISTTNSVTYTMTTTGPIAADISVYAGFPSTIDTTGASIGCTANGVAISGSSSLSSFGPIDIVFFQGSGGVAGGVEVACTVTNLTGPDTAGVYTGGVFTINTDGSGALRGALVDWSVSYTFTEGTVDPGGGCDECVLPVIELPTYDVTVVTPNGGEVIKSGSIYPISWTADDEVEFVNLAYSVDGGHIYKDIVRGVPNTGSIAWNVPKVESDEMLVRIQSTDLVNVRNDDESDAVFSVIDPTKPFITWRSPASNSSLQAGTKQWLLWDSSKVITEIELSLSVDGGLTYPITTGKVKNANAYQLQLPSTDVQGAYIKIVGYAKGFSPIEVITGPLSILTNVDTAALKVTAPNVMQAFVAGQKTTITWETTGNVPLVELQFAADGKSWAPISEFIPNTGSYEWTVRDVESEYAFIRVGGTSAFGKYVSDRSDEPFWIVRTIVPAVTITSPKALTEFSVGGVLKVMWDTVGTVPYTNLYIVFADGVKNILALGIQNVGLFETKIPEMPMNTFTILLEGLDEKGNILSGDKAGPFSIIVSPPEPGIEPPAPIWDCLIWGNCEGGTTDNGTVTDGGEDISAGIIFTPPGSSGDVVEDDVEIAIFDQSGLELYAEQVKPRVTVANGTIELDPRKRMDVIIGSSLLVELITGEGDFMYATNDGRSEPLEVSETGVRFAYVPVGSDTTHVKFQSQGMEPPYSLSLRITPQPQGYVEGLENKDGSEEVVLLKGTTEWDSSATGQPNPVRLGTDGLFAWYAPNGAYTVELHDGNGALVEKKLTITNNIVNPVLTLGESVVEDQIPFLVDLLLPDDVQDIVIAAVEDVRANETAQAVATVAVPVAAVAVVTGATVLGSSFSLLSYLQYLFTSPFLLFGRRKRRSYGTVYNAITKAPVPFATIRFYDKDNRIARSIVTDPMGRYTVTLPPGQYRPVVVKPGFLFPSEQILSDIDGDLENVYNSGFIDVTVEMPFVQIHFPIDPDQIAGRIVSLRRVAVLRTLQYTIAFSGVLIALYAVFMNPNKTTVGLLILQGVVLFVSFKLTKVHARTHIGKVVDANGKPMAGAIVRLFESTYNKLVETQRTDAQGRYSFFAKDGSFYVVAETVRGKVTSSKIDYRGEMELKPVAPVLKI